MLRHARSPPATAAATGPPAAAKACARVGASPRRVLLPRTFRCLLHKVCVRLPLQVAPRRGRRRHVGDHAPCHHGGIELVQLPKAEGELGVGEAVCDRVARARGVVAWRWRLPARWPAAGFGGGWRPVGAVTGADRLAADCMRSTTSVGAGVETKT